MLTESAAAFPPLRLGALLRHHNGISALQLERALEAQRHTGLRLGAQLQALGFASAEVVLRALAEQAHADYLTHVDWTWLQRAPGGLPIDTVRALGLVPFEADEQRRRLYVMCPAPVSKTSLSALVALTNWTPQPYMVDDATWARALDEYRPARTRVSLLSRLVSDVRSACAQVADAAVESGPVTMRHAALPTYTWVRVEAPAHVRDVLVSATEGLCLAASTAQ
jgi:hypothetical protein